MKRIKAISLTSGVNDWLANTREPHVLHVFDRACNLINEQKDVLSIVAPKIGNGPFNLVLETDSLFVEHLSIESIVSASANQLVLGDLTIHTAGAQLWDASPDWELLNSRRDEIAQRMLALTFPDHQFSNPLTASLSSALLEADVSAAKTIASKLAGLGQGLTPSGDDFMMGALHAAWILHPPKVATDLAQGVAESAAPLTTSLSAAWIRSAGRGEAGELWYQFFNALVAGDEIRIKESVEKILAVGETSGADALAGFTGALKSWVEDISATGA